MLRDLPQEVAAISAVAFCVALGFGIVGPVIPAFAREFKVSAFAAGLVVSLFAAMRLAGAPLAAWLIDRYDERKVLAYGLATLALTTFLAGLSAEYWQLLFFRGISGLGSIAFSVSSLSLLIKVSTPEQRGRAAAAWSGGFLAGGLTGPVFGGVFVAWSLRAPFFVYAFTLVMASLVAWRGLAHSQFVSESESDEAPTLSLRAAARLYNYRSVVFSNFANGFVRFGVVNALPAIFVVEVLKLDPVVTSAGFLLSSAAQAVLLSRAGRLTDTLGRKPVIIAGASATLISQALLLLHPQVIWFMLSMLVLGFSGAFMSSAPSAILGDLTGGKARGPVLAATQMAGDLGSVLGPLVGGYVLDVTGSFPAAFSTGLAVMGLSWLLLWRMTETRPATKSVDLAKTKTGRCRRGCRAR